MKILNLFAQTILIFSALLCCNAQSLQSLSYIQELKDKKRDNENYEKVQNIEREIQYNNGRTLDVYYDINNNNESKPVYIFIYGGNWVSGDNIKFTNFGSLLEKNGYVAVLPNYILFPKGSFEDMVDDIYKAVLWTSKNIEKYGGDPNRISIAAYSAGAHLTALTLIKSVLGKNNKSTILEPLPELEKVILLNGPYDFEDYSVVRKMFGKNTNNSSIDGIIKLFFQSKDISPIDILKPIPDNSLNSLGAKKFVFFYTSLDDKIEKNSAVKFIKQMNRVYPDVDISYVYKDGYKHTTLTNGVRASSAEEENVFMSLVDL